MYNKAFLSSKIFISVLLFLSVIVLLILVNSRWIAKKNLDKEAFNSDAYYNKNSKTKTKKEFNSILNDTLMSPYNKDYFFIEANYDEYENLPDLGAADANTRNRFYRFEQQPVGSAPLMFNNNYRDAYIQEGAPLFTPLPPVLFCGSDILVTTAIRQELLKYNIPHLYMHPAVYIHDDDEWYEGYWFCTFVERFDCWDRETSDYLKQDFDPDEYPSYLVKKFDLNTDLLDNTPLEQRLLFKMGASSFATITCHKSIKHLFENKGVHLTPVGEW